MAEDVFAEIHSPVSALAGDRRKRLDFESFTRRILRLAADDGHQIPRRKEEGERMKE